MVDIVVAGVIRGNGDAFSNLISVFFLVFAIIILCTDEIKT